MSSTPMALMPPPPFSRSSAIVRAGRPAAASSSSVSDRDGSPDRHRSLTACHPGQHRADLAERRRCPAGRPVGRRTASTKARRAAYCSSSTSSATDSTGVTQVSAAASSATQASRSWVAKAARKSARIFVLDVVVELVVHPLLAAEQPAQVGEELGFDGADGQPPTVGGPVGVVTGVPTGDDVVPVAHVGPGGQVLVHGQRGQPQHPVGDGHVEVDAGPVVAPPDEGGHHRHGRLHPAAGGVGDGGARHRWPAVGRRLGGGQVAARRPGS